MFGSNSLAEKFRNQINTKQKFGYNLNLKEGSKNLTPEEIERRRKERKYEKMEKEIIVEGDPYSAQPSFIRKFKRMKKYISYWSDRMEDLR